MSKITPLPGLPKLDLFREKSDITLTFMWFLV